MKIDFIWTAKTDDIHGGNYLVWSLTLDMNHDCVLRVRSLISLGHELVTS